MPDPNSTNIASGGEVERTPAKHPLGKLAVPAACALVGASSLFLLQEFGLVGSPGVARVIDLAQRGALLAQKNLDLLEISLGNTTNLITAANAVVSSASETQAQILVVACIDHFGQLAGEATSTLLTSQPGTTAYIGAYRRITNSSDALNEILTRASLPPTMTTNLTSLGSAVHQIAILTDGRIDNKDRSKVMELQSTIRTNSQYFSFQLTDALPFVLGETNISSSPGLNSPSSPSPTTLPPAQYLYTADVRSALNSFRKWDGSIADRIDPKIQQTLSHEDIVAIGREVLQKLFGAKANGAMRAAADKNFPKYPKLSGMSTSDVIAAEARYEDQVRDFLVGQKLKDIPLGAAKTAGLFLQQPEIPGAKDAFGHAALYCYYGIDEAGIGKPESGKK